MKVSDFAKYLSTFLGTYLPGIRNVSTNTIRSYRDTYRLLLQYCKKNRNLPVEKISLILLSKELILNFLDWLQKERGNCLSTRNQRLAAIHAFFRYVQLEEPIMIASCQKILEIPFKKHQKPTINHLSAKAMRLILEQPNKENIWGLRDLALLSVLYDTGARVQELVDLRLRDIRLEDPSTVLLTGKGRKTRYVPLMSNTKMLLKRYLDEVYFQYNGSENAPLFMNHQHKKMTRAGICYIVKKYSRNARSISPIVPETVTPHVFRHTKAMHLYQSGVNLIYIRDLLGHVDIATTDIYARADTEMKRKAIEKAYPSITKIPLPDWNDQGDLLTWLNSL